MARGLFAVTLTFCLFTNAVCLPPNIHRLRKNVADNEISEVNEVGPSSSGPAEWTPDPFDDDDDDDFTYSSSTSSSGGGSNVFSLLRFASALFPSFSGTNTLRRIQNLLRNNTPIQVSLRRKGTKLNAIHDAVELTTDITKSKFGRQEIEQDSEENSSSESNSSSDSVSSEEEKNINNDTSNKNNDTPNENNNISSENVDSSNENDDTSNESIDSSSVNNDTSDENIDSSRENNDTSKENIDNSNENNDDSEENTAAEESSEMKSVESSSKQDSVSATDSNESDDDYDEPPGGDGQGGGILGILAGLSGGGSDETDLGTLLGAISSIVVNLSGDNFDLNSVIASGVGLFAGLLSEGEENPGAVLASYLLTSLDTITNGGANNNGVFFGRFLSKLLKGISAVDDSQESSEENSDENKMTMADSAGFFTSFLMGLLGDMSKGSSGGSGS